MFVNWDKQKWQFTEWVQNDLKKQKTKNILEKTVQYSDPPVLTFVLFSCTVSMYVNGYSSHVVLYNLSESDHFLKPLL